MTTKPKASKRKATVKNTKTKLLEAAQEILAEGGLGALNSNAIVEKAGVTPPTFYHYFANKHAILEALGRLMMQAQSEVLRADTGLQISTKQELYTACRKAMHHSYRMTRDFRGGYALLVSLRAVPELRPLRLNYHIAMSVILAEYLLEQGFGDNDEDLQIRSRLGLEMAYAAIEMLIETNSKNQKQILDYTAQSLTQLLVRE